MDMAGKAEEAPDIQVPEEQVNVEHPEKLVNETPESLVSGFNLVTEFVVANGWYFVLAVVVLFYLRHRFKSQISQLMKDKSDRDYYKKYDTETALARQEGRQRALMKMQEENDVKAMENYEKEQQKEEEKRLQRVEEWEDHKKGKSYRSKIYKPKQEEEPTTTSATKKPKPKSTFRPDEYNPLMGGSGSGFRPPRQRSNRGG